MNESKFEYDENEFGYIKKSKKRKFKFDQKHQKRFILNFLMIFLLMEMFFVGNYLLSCESVKKMKFLLTELKTSYLILEKYNYYFNVLR